LSSRGAVEESEGCCDMLREYERAKLLIGA